MGRRCCRCCRRGDLADVAAGRRSPSGRGDRHHRPRPDQDLPLAAGVLATRLTGAFVAAHECRSRRSRCRPRRRPRCQRSRRSGLPERARSSDSEPSVARIALPGGCGVVAQGCRSRCWPAEGVGRRANPLPLPAMSLSKIVRPLSPASAKAARAACPGCRCSRTPWRRGDPRPDERGVVAAREVGGDVGRCRPVEVQRPRVLRRRGPELEVGPVLAEALDGLSGRWQLLPRNRLKTPGCRWRRRAGPLRCSKRGEADRRDRRRRTGTRRRCRSQGPRPVRT